MNGFSKFILFCFLNFVVLQTLPPCTEDNLTGDYTRCLYLSDTRTLFYHYDATCDASNAPVPPNPISNLPCDISCPAGYFLPLNSTDCEICSSGSYSLGGGSSFYRWEDNFPKTGSVVFTTYCSDLYSIEPSSDYPYCGWTLNGYDTESGDLTGMDSINSILEVSVVLLEEGSIEFQYMCDVEHIGNAFVYKLDNEDPVNLPLTAEFITRSVSLSAGTHDFRWIFYKNPEVGTGEDLARINWVQIFGLTPADDKACTLCPAGTFQPDEGQPICMKCPANTYAPEEGSSECIPCEGGYSIEGSSECIPFTSTCSVEDDALQYYTECVKEGNDWVRTMYYQWQVPLLCDNSGISLPENITNQECAPCPPGSYLSEGSERTCVFCNSGEYSDGESCATCSAGTVAIPVSYYNEWDQWADGFTTFCYGECVDNGWQLYHDNVQASLHAGVVNDLLLNFEIYVGYGGGITYSWNIHGSMEGSKFEVTVDGEFAQIATHSHGTEHFDLSYGYHTIAFWAHGDGETTSRVTISSIIVQGSQIGGADTCTPCPAGYYQSNDGEQGCIPCSPGRYSDTEGTEKCSKCESDTYASRSGSTECVPCPGGGSSSSGASYCSNPECIYLSSDGENSYNLSPYAGIPQYVDNEDNDFSGYFLVSYCGYLYENDSPCENSFVCEVYDKFNPFSPARNYLDWGDFVEFQENDDPLEGFSLIYTGGELNGCETNRTVIVEFTCESDVDKYTSLDFSSSRSTDCQSIFTQKSIYGCPVCTTDDFEKNEGECVDGEKEIEYVKKKTSQCNGVVKSSTESCGGLSINFGMAVIVIVLFLIAILLLLVAVAWFVMKHQRLKIKYTQLQSSSNVEMGELGEDLEEDEL